MVSSISIINMNSFIIIIIIIALSFDTNFVHPANNLKIDKNLITFNDDKARAELTELSRHVMKVFNSNKNLASVMGPSDLSSFMTSLHHALIVIKNQNQTQVSLSSLSSLLDLVLLLYLITRIRVLQLMIMTAIKRNFITYLH